MKNKIIVLEIPMDLWAFVDMQASDRAHHKNYTIDEMIECKPQCDQIIKWLKEIQENKLRYRKG